jgi:protease IV
MTLLLAAFVAFTPQMPLSISTTDDALSVFANPAALGLGRGADFYCIYNFRSVLVQDMGTNLTLAGSLGPVGAFWAPGDRYGLALGAGPREFMLGARVLRDTLTRWDVGLMSRPTRWLSLGLLWQDLGHDLGTWQVGAAVRPLGSRLTLVGEVYLRQPLLGLVGIEAEPVDGVTVSARVLPGASVGETNLSAGLTLGLGKAGIGVFGTRYPSEIAGFVRAGSAARRSLLPSGRKCVDIKLSEAVEDQKPGFSLSMRPTRTTWDLLTLLKQCRDDKGVRAVLLEFDGASMSLAQAQEVRSGIQAVRAAGKKVYAYSDSYGMLGYFLASACDRVITHVQGGVDIPGLSMQTPFLKGALEKLGLKVDYSRHGKYKSAVEIFSEDSLTAPNREQYEALLDAMYGEFVDAVAAGRSLSRDSVGRLVDHAWFMPAQAKAAGLVDTFCYRDELDSLLKADLKGLRRTDEKEFADPERYEYEWQDRPAVAVIYAGGEIGNGESGTDFLQGSSRMGAQTMIRAIAAARKDKRVKAIVLRIDSPGGDGFASDLIWHELELTLKKKPVIVSMGGVAASGGYYIACNAKRVFAEPATLTGSIGVFSLKFVTEGLFNKLGIRRQVVKRGEHADASSDVRENTPEEDSMVQAQADWFYEQFVRKVADGRKLTFERVDSVGQGRVWAGSDARRIGLVDTLGGLIEAVEYAKTEAHLKECDFVFYPKPRTDFLSKLGGFARERIMSVVYE